MTPKEYKRQWYLRNRDRILESRRSNYDKNRAAEYNKRYRKLNKDSIARKRAQKYKMNKAANNEYQRSYYRSSIERRMFSKAKSRARAKGLDFDINLEDVEIPEKCPVLGIELSVGDGKVHDNSPSLDRIDNTKGYVKGNVIVISNRANVLKKDATVEELELLAKFYAGIGEA